MQISVEVVGNKQLMRKLVRLGVDLKDYSTPMKEIGKQLANYYAGPAFLSQGAVFGKKWPKLSPAYQRYKAKHYRTFANTMLVRSDSSDAMRNEFESVSTKTTAVIGNNAKYFKYHQSTAPRTKIPRRAMMGVNDPVRTIVKDILDDDIKKKLRSK